jgi:para-aminobenzoate synthetase component 1
VKGPGDRPLAAFRQELPYREIAPLALAFARRGEAIAFLDSSADPATDAESRFSVLGWRPTRTIAWPVGRPGAIEGIRRFLGPPRLAPDPASPVPYRGGFLGWIAYDIGRHVERLPSRLPVDPRVPDFVLAEFEALLVEDRRDRRLFFTGVCDPMEGPSRLFARQAEALEAFQRLRAEGAGASAPHSDDAVVAAGGPHGSVVPRSDISRDVYLTRLSRVLSYIVAGDIFQANLAHRFTAPLSAPVDELYRRLRTASPAPWGCLLRLGGPDVLSISPELFLARTGEVVTTRPIKGTRPRGADAAEDARLRAELESSEKDRAELAMIVDLLRNDLGRVARTGTVRVPVPREIRAHPTVFHSIATVVAEVPRDVHAADLVAATMPGGSVTGAPKIRAMEILEELEDVRRGPYCGSAGWFGYDGDLRLNILIRTLCVLDGAVSFHVGGGIVADSDPAAEHEETLVKARALIAALTGSGR